MAVDHPVVRRIDLNPDGGAEHLPEFDDAAANIFRQTA